MKKKHSPSTFRLGSVRRPDAGDPLSSVGWRIGKIYSPSFCEDVIRFGREGMSISEMAVELGVSLSTFNDWTASRTEFKEAVEYALLHARAWWEKAGRLNLQNPHFNSSLWLMQMSNRFGYTRRIEGKFETVTEEVKRAELSIQLGSAEDIRKVIGILDKSGAIPKLLADNPEDEEKER